MRAGGERDWQLLQELSNVLTAAHISWPQQDSATSLQSLSTSLRSLSTLLFSHSISDMLDFIQSKEALE